MLQAAIAVSNSRVLDFLRGLVESIKKSYEIHRTYHELNNLTDAELKDIGIHRSEIASIALNSVYKHTHTKEEKKMTALVLNRVINPFKEMWEVFSYAMYMHGLARAARELQRLGYNEEASKLFEEMRKNTNL